MTFYNTYAFLFLIIIIIIFEKAWNFSLLNLNVKIILKVRTETELNAGEKKYSDLSRAAIESKTVIFNKTKTGSETKSIFSSGTEQRLFFDSRNKS